VRLEDYRKLRHDPQALLEAAEAEQPLPRRVKVPQPPSQGEETLRLFLDAAGIAYEREYPFYPERGWRFDFAFPEQRVAVEVDGAMWGVQGRHQRPDHLAEQNDKGNAATLLGWRLLRFTTAQVLSGDAFGMILKALKHNQET
jgi:very-short-patch-repair endonuclease